MLKSSINSRKTIFTIIISMILVSVLLISGCGKKKKEDAKVKIACNLPMTGSFATYGTAVQNGVLLALDDLEESSPDLRKQMSFNWGDNTGKAKQTINLMNQQLLNNPNIYISGVKPQTMAIFDQIQQKGIPHFVWIFDAFITGKGDNVFRTWTNYKYEPDMYLKYIKYKKANKIALVYVNFPHVVEEVEEILKPEILSAGIPENNLLIDAYNWEEKDFKNIVTKIRNFNPDLILLNGFQSNLVGLVKALRSYNMIHNGNVIATYDMLDAANILTAEELEGVRVIVPEYNVNRSDKIIEFDNKYQKKYNKHPLYTDAYAYDMTMILADAVRRTKVIDNEKLIDSISSTDINGLTGKLKFDDTGDLILSLKIAYYHNGSLILDESCN